jgi:hypothetical protein
MKIYYTGATKANQPQQQTNLSLGGYASSTQVPNNQLSAMFPTESYQGLRQSQDFICVALRIEQDMNLKVGILKNNVSEYNFEIGFSSFNDDLMTVSTIDRFSEPFDVSFQEEIMLDENDATNTAFLEDLRTGTYIGFWIKRINQKVPNNYDNMCLIANNPDSAEDGFSIVFFVDDPTNPL